MNAGSSRGFPRKTVTYFDKRIYEQPENIGNRKTFDEIKIPPDNVGNKIDRDPIATFIHDGLGNSLDDEPSHLKSGILTHLAGHRTRQIKRSTRERILIDANSADEPSRGPHFENVVHKTEKVANSRPPTQKASLERKKWVETNRIATVGNVDFIAHVANDFKKSLEERIGTPFSFSMRALINNDLDTEGLKTSLNALKILIEGIFKVTSIDATVSYLQYGTDEHRFAVFFVNPQEKDPVKNKDLISALRHVVKSHVGKFISDEINVFLVLANAKIVIEGHLAKIGAVKIDED